MPLVTRFRVSHNTDKNDGVQSKSRRHNSRAIIAHRVRCECTLVLVLLAIIAMVTVGAGAALSVVSYNSGRIMGLGGTHTNPDKLRKNSDLSGLQKSQYTSFYNMRCIGPIIKGVGFFALIISAVVAYQDDNGTSQADNTSGEDCKHVLGDVYDRGVQLFRMEQAVQQQQKTKDQGA